MGILTCQQVYTLVENICQTLVIYFVLICDKNFSSLNLCWHVLPLAARDLLRQTCWITTREVLEWIAPLILQCGKTPRDQERIEPVTEFTSSIFFTVSFILNYFPNQRSDLCMAHTHVQICCNSLNPACSGIVFCVLDTTFVLYQNICIFQERIVINHKKYL